MSNSFVRTRLAIAWVLAAVGAAAAQQAPGIQPQATGTGSIRGRVVGAGTNTPVAGARLTLHQTRGETPAGVSQRYEYLTTDDTGTFEFQNLPAGQFSIEATAEGYLDGEVGKRRPQGEGMWIPLKAGQMFSGAVIELFREELSAAS